MCTPPMFVLYVFYVLTHHPILDRNVSSVKNGSNFRKLHLRSHMLLRWISETVTGPATSTRELSLIATSLAVQLEVVLGFS